MEDCAILAPIIILDKKEYENNGWKVDHLKITPPLPIPKGMFIGIDPGTVNLGICIFMFNQVNVYKVKLNRDKNPVNRMLNTKHVLSFIVPYQEYGAKVCIEGASYGDIYRQAELAEIRAACVFWGIDHGMDVKIAQPSEIRKAVLGNGNMKGKEIWKGILSGDAADALVCAYYAGM